MDDVTIETQLSPIEAKAVSSFLKVVNSSIRGDGSTNPMSERTALKFLFARKFDIERSLELYRMHEITRLHEGLASIDPSSDDLKQELESGKFTILKTRNANNSAIAIFTAKLHTKNQGLKNKVHRQTLQGIVYQLDAALEDIVTQRYGIIFIYNMGESDFSNFDFELCQKIFKLLKGAYPAKLKKVLIVSPPLWFRYPFQVFRHIAKEKLRDRVWLISANELPSHILPQSLPIELGGQHQHNHQAWISECNNLYKTRYNDLCDPISAQNLVKSLSQRFNFKRLSQDATNANESDNPSQNNDSTSTKGGKQQQYNNHPTYDYDDQGMSLSQLVDLVKKKGKSGLGEEYESILRNEKVGTFAVSSSPYNMKKNRYINVKCYDHTRVVLEPYDLPMGIGSDDTMDYINASFVDGYRQQKAYISTQGPMMHTLGDFWRMMWQTGSRVIVMVTLNIENDMLKCDRYWPCPENRKIDAGVYVIEFIGIENHDDFIATHLKLTNTRTELSRDIWHLQFVSWPDFGTPLTAIALLNYRSYVLKKQLDAIESADSYPPITVHCSAGVGRSGTFITIDTCIQKLEITGLVDVKSVVVKLREQRYSSIQTKDQYIFCYKSVLEYAANCGLLDIDDLKNLLS